MIAQTSQGFVRSSTHHGDGDGLLGGADGVGGGAGVQAAVRADGALDAEHRAPHRRRRAVEGPGCGRGGDTRGHALQLQARPGEHLNTRFYIVILQNYPKNTSYKEMPNSQFL